MLLQYQLTIPPLPKTLSLGDPILCIGSCFAEHMGQKMAHFQLPVQLNPTGILFNPIHIAQHILFSLDNKPAYAHLIEHDGLWHSWLHHGQFSHPSKEALINQIQMAHDNFKASLTTAKLIVFTWGNAWVYAHHSLQMKVANCHKVPASAFSKSLVQPEEIASTFTKALEAIYRHNPAVQVVMSISPVKYLRWGAHENNLGKSSLFLGLNQLRLQHPSLHYFPSYEWLNDVLRDYRFYDTDLAHPNSLAIEAIWEQFKAFGFNPETLAYMHELAAILVKNNHKILHPEAPSSKNFKEKIALEQADFKRRYPHTVFDSTYNNL